jgi:hypothetical protein
MRRRIIILLTLLYVSGSSYGQDASEKEKKWYVPEYTKWQFAGAIGFISGGVGYVHSKEKMETELMLGFLPKSIGGDHLTSLTVKTNFLPWKVPLKENKWDLIPLQLGGYLSYTFGSEFDTFLPEQYPSGYYWWPSSLRLGMFAGSRIRYYTGAESKLGPIDVYYELGTYDLKLISYVLNVESLSVFDMLNISFGVKVEF